MKDQKNFNIGSKLGANSKEHWQVNVDALPEGKNDAYGAFNPKSPKHRPKIYSKINECDY